MVCCALIAALLGLLTWPIAKLRTSPLAWRPAPTEIVQADGWFESRVASIGYAISGLRFAARNEPNMRVHVLAALAAVIAGVLTGISLDEWRWLALAVTLVIAAEAMNTAVEQTCNAITGRRDPVIGRAKDLAAGAVLVTALFAALIGATIFAPYLVATPGHDFCGYPIS